MLRRTIADPRFVDSPRDAAVGYFIDGDSCATRFERVVHEALGFAKGRPLSILEFASGFGRVSRHLPSRFPNSFIVAADVHEEAVRFYEDRLGMASVLSPSTPEQLAIPHEFDIVFALSFFTHMPPSTFGRWIGALYRHLKRGGFLIFTASGWRPFIRGGRDPSVFDKHNAIFVPNSEQFDIDTADYGTMWATPGYVIGEIWKYTQAPIVLLHENFWWELQDLYVITKHAAIAGSH